MECNCQGSDALSVVAIIISLFAILFEWRSQVKLNRINLNAEYFKHLFFDTLLKDIPKERGIIDFNKEGYLTNYTKFVDGFLEILNNSQHYKYTDRRYYEKLREKVMELEDYVYTVANKPVGKALHTDIYNNIDEKVKEIYDQLTKKYEKG